MSKQWNEFANSSAYQNLTDEEKQSAQQRYYEAVIYPEVAGTPDVQSAREKFLRVANPTVTDKALELGGKAVDATLGLGGEAIAGAASLAKRGINAIANTDVSKLNLDPAATSQAQQIEKQRGSIDTSGSVMAGKDGAPATAPTAEGDQALINVLDKAAVDNAPIDDDIKAFAGSVPQMKPEGFSEIAGNALGRTLKNTTAMNKGIVALGLDVVGADETALSVLKSAVKTQNEAAGYPAAIEDFTKINSWGDVPTYVLEGVLENSGMLVQSVFAGGVGAGIAKGLGKEKMEGMLAGAAKKELAKRIAIGGATGAGASSIGMESGSIYNDIYTETGEMRPAVALAFGTLAGSLDAIPAARAVRTALGGKLVEEAGKSLIKRYGVEAAKQIMQEGGTEFLQTWVEKGAVSYVDGREVLNEKNLIESADAMLKGGAAGGATHIAAQGFNDAVNGVDPAAKAAEQAKQNALGAWKNNGLNAGKDRLTISQGGNVSDEALAAEKQSQYDNDLAAKKAERLKTLPDQNLTNLRKTAETINPADVPVIDAEIERRANLGTLSRASEAGLREETKQQNEAIDATELYGADPINAVNGEPNAITAGNQSPAIGVVSGAVEAQPDNVSGSVGVGANNVPDIAEAPLSSDGQGGTILPRSGGSDAVIPQQLTSDTSTADADTSTVEDSSTIQAQEAAAIDSKMPEMTQSAPVPTTGAVEQNRNRSSVTSIQQMKAIAKAPDFYRAGISNDMQTGSPVVVSNNDEQMADAVYGSNDVTVDGKGNRYDTQYAVIDAAKVNASHDVEGNENTAYTNKVDGAFRSIAGNGRTAGIQQAYKQGTAKQYKADLISKAGTIGIDAAKIKGMKSPLLVRVMKSSQLTDDIGDLSNISQTAQLSPVEQARTDAQRLELGALEFTDDGDVSSNVIMQWVSTLPQTEQSGLTSNGRITTQATDRLNAAIFFKAYGSDELTRLYAEAVDQESRNVISAIGAAAPILAQLEGRGDLDVRGAVVEAAGIIVSAKRSKGTVAEYMNNLDAFVSAEARVLAQFFFENINAKRKLADGLKDWSNYVLDNSKSTNQSIMFEEAAPKNRAQLFERFSDGKQQGQQQSEGSATTGQGTQQETNERAGQDETARGGEGIQLQGQTNEEINAALAKQEADAKAKRNEEAKAKAEQAVKDNSDVESRLKAAAENPDNFVFGEGKKDVTKAEVDLFGARNDAPVQQPAANADEITHNGNRIYKVKIRNRVEGQPPTEMWAVESLENKAKRDAGERTIGGDGLFNSIDEAKSEADGMLAQAKSNEETKARVEAEQKAEAAAKAAKDSEKSDIDGFGADLNPMQLGKVKASLEKQVRVNGVQSTLKEAVRKLVADGAKPSVAQENAYKGMSRVQYNRADNREQQEDERRIREGGKKSVYYIDGFDLGKTAHDYANHLLSKQNADVTETDFGNKPAADSEAAAKAKADLNSALGDLGDIFGKDFKAMMLPEQEQKIFPVLTRLFDAAFRLGYIEFKTAAKFVLDTIRSKIGNDVADVITIDHLQGAYITMAGNYKGQATSKKDVVSVESIDEIQGESNVTNERSSADLESDSGNAKTTNSVGEKSIQAGRKSDGESGRSGVQDTESESRAGSSNGLLGSETAIARERSDIEIYTGSPTVTSGTAGNSIDSGSGDSGIDGAPIEPEATERINEVAQGGLFQTESSIKQKKADKLTQELTLENVIESLPILHAGQQEDVFKAESKFAEPEGYGMLFTNGTGTGKTFTGLGIVKRYANRGKDNIIIVAPNDKIIEDWQKSGKLLGLNLNRLNDTTDAGKGVVVTTYANMGANLALADRNWDLVVHDEAHYLAMDKDGTNTNALKVLRAISNHPDGQYHRANMLNRDLIAEIVSLDEQLKTAKVAADSDSRAFDKVDKISAKLDAANEKLKENNEKVKEQVKASQGAGRTRSLFLSATPFAYEKTVDWAQGYLFDYKEGQGEESQAYNAGSHANRFMMQHFGYRMRYNKLTQPDAKVDTGLMQRQFNTWLKKKGVLSSRMLDVEADYDRKFVLIDSAIGTRIDEALQWFEEQRKALPEDGAIDNREKKKQVDSLYAVQKLISSKFDYLSRRYLLEAIKAKAVVEHVKEHMAMGRKVVVFHDYKKGGGFNPFDIQEIDNIEDLDESYAGVDVDEVNNIISRYRSEFNDLITSPEFESSSPIDTFKAEFPQVLLFNGDVPKQIRRNNVAKFQDDASGAQVILVQSAAGKEGISLHDTTGKHQRVLFNLGQPTQPTTSIQQEGRIYRTGQVTDAIFRYLNTGTNWERWAFAETIAKRASAAENLAMGEQARALKDAFITGFEESDNYRAGMEGEGKGGKERDRAANEALSEYDRAKAFYYGTQKKSAKNKAQEGKDYFATPEPVGLKMVEFANLRAGEKALEPSAGHGAIARWFPDDVEKYAVEPSMALRPRLAMVFDGSIINTGFEELNVVNKFDAIIMNPPFGSAGKMAIDHVAKAATHLRDGGRIVALIPVGSTDQKFDKWFYEKEERAVKPVGVLQGKTVAGEKYPDRPLYKGDTVETNLSWLPKELKVQRSKNGYFDLKADGVSQEYSIESDNIIKVTKTGARTEEYSPAAGLSLVADIKLPSVTFERAGTAVNTRIVVIEKSDNAPQQINRDYRDVKDINELFDRMEDLELKGRAKPVEEVAAEAPAKESRQESVKAKDQAAKARDEQAKAAGAIATNGEGVTFEIKGDKLITNAPTATVTTSKGKALEGVFITDNSISMDKAKEADKFAYYPKGKAGGIFVRLRHVERPSGDDTAFSLSSGDDPVYYSALTQAIEKMKANKQPAAAWKGVIKNLAGVKPDEIEWTGVNEWLDLQAGAVTKDQLLDYLNANGVQVTETMLGNANDIDITEPDTIPEDLQSLLDEYEDGDYQLKTLVTKAKKIGYKLNVGMDGEIDDVTRIGSANEATKYSKYTVAGGENYKELLLTLPEKKLTEEDFEKFISKRGLNLKDFNEVDIKVLKAQAKSKLIKDVNYKSSHFDQSNILAHVRFDERVDADGNKVLFINEIQSDWGQDGKKKGFKLGAKQYTANDIELVKESEYTWTLKAKDNNYQMNVSKADYEYNGGLKKAILDTAEVFSKDGLEDRYKVQPAPFVQKTDAWVSLAIKRMIRYAAENGFDKVAIINGQQAADLYDLSKQVDFITHNKADNGYYVAIMANGSSVINEVMSEEKLEQTVGKDIAQKIINGEGKENKDGYKTLEGVDLKVGGEGMRTFYDSIVPKVAKDVLKKLGGKVENVRVPSLLDTKQYYDALGLNKSDIKIERDGAWWTATSKDGKYWDGGSFVNDEGKTKLFETKEEVESSLSSNIQLGFTITDEMRPEVMKGLPLFSQGSNPVKGLPVATVEAMVKRVSKGWKNTPTVYVITSLQDPRVPENVRAKDAELKSRGSKGNPIGFISKGKVYVMASMVSSEADVAEVIMHEIFGHYGLRGNFGDVLSNVLEQMIVVKGDLVRTKAKQYKLDYTNKSERMQAAEEVLAEMAQTNPSLGFVKRAIAAIRTWLRKNIAYYKNLEITDDEIINNILIPARNFVKNGVRNKNDDPLGFGKLKPVYKSNGVRFALSDQTNTPQFKKWFGNSKVVDSRGNPLVVYHGAPDARFAKEDGIFKNLTEQYGGEGGSRAFWFASSRQTANTYADDRRAFYYQSAEAGIIEAYLSLQNPLIVEGNGRAWREAQAIGKTSDVIEKAQNEGHDGVIIRNVKDDYNSNATSNRITDTYVVFTSNQIKSATNNNGDFDPDNRSINFSLTNPEAGAGNARPVAKEGGAFDRLLQIAGKPFAKHVTQPLYRKAAELLDSKYLLGSNAGKIIKAGMIADYGLDEQYLDRRDEIEARMNAHLRKSKNLIQSIAGLSRQESRIAYQWLQEKPDTDAEQALMDQLPADSIAFLEQIKTMIEDLSQEAIALGQLKPEQYERNKYSYLHRSYAKYEIEAEERKDMKAGARRRVLGDQYKGRGLQFMVDPERLDTGESDNPIEKGMKFVRLESRNEAGILTKRVWWNAAVEVPPMYRDLEVDPVQWEVRGDKKGKVILWRDFTKEERERMGELDEAKFAVAMTVSKMAHDIEIGKFFEFVDGTYAQDEAPEGAIVVDNAGESAWSKGNLVDALADGAWVKVPDTKIQGTDVEKYGAIAGKYVSGAIWNDIRQIMNTPSVPQWYSTVMRFWKISKTALSPAVHLNNVMANMIMADMHDVQARHMVKAIEVMWNARKGGDAQAFIDRFEDSGAIAGTYVHAELKDDMMKPLLEELRREIAGTQSATDQMHTIANALSVMYKEYHDKGIRKGMSMMATTKAAKLATAIPEAMINTYQNEDVIFRLAAFIKGLDQGKTDREAGKEARKAFLDYRINAPWVQGLRQTVLPFIAFTYRMIPMYIETVRDKPWKIAKYMMVANALAAVGMAMAGIGDDDDDEIQKLLPEDRKGLTPFMTERQIPVGKDKNGNIVYLDTTRWVPLGDIFELQGESSNTMPMAGFANPAGVIMLIGDLVWNRSRFTGRDVWQNTDTTSEAAGKVMEAFYKGMVPNNPLLPYTYSSDKIANALGDKVDMMGRDYSMAQALASSFGIKVNTYDKSQLEYNKMQEIKADQREITGNMRRLSIEYGRKGITKEQYEKRIKAEQDKLNETSEQLK